MKKAVQRPIIKINSFYNNDRSIEDVFADVYALIFADRQKMKSSDDTFVSGEQSHYNDDSKAKEDGKDGTAA